jgi:hypothetical protein
MPASRLRTGDSPMLSHTGIRINLVYQLACGPGWTVGARQRAVSIATPHFER